MKVGDKVLGFEFGESQDGNVNNFHYSKYMDFYIDKVGEIIEIKGTRIRVEFPHFSAWWYPKEEARRYLVKETETEINFKLLQ